MDISKLKVGDKVDIAATVTIKRIASDYVVVTGIHAGGSNQNSIKSSAIVHIHDRPLVVGDRVHQRNVSPSTYFTVTVCHIMDDKKMLVCLQGGGWPNEWVVRNIDEYERCSE